MNDALKFEKAVFYVKTMSFSRDHRVKKEIESLLNVGVSVDVVVFCDDSVPQTFMGARIHEYRGITSSAPRNLFVRIGAALAFCRYSLRYCKRSGLLSKRRVLHWVADPILFPLVILLKKHSRGEVLWDHHELPPRWVVGKWLTRKFYSTAYRKADVVVHANRSRMNFLEDELGVKANRGVIINNYPKDSDFEIERPVEKLRSIVEGSMFVFLQNSIEENRCGPAIFAAVKRAGLKIVHAGPVNSEQMARLEGKVAGISEFCVFPGALSLQEITWLLRRAYCTIICYKKTSFNQIYCEPNRLYHAISVGAKVIVGDNPTMKEEVIGVPRAIVLKGDGSDVDNIVEALEAIRCVPGGDDFVHVPAKSWGKCDENIRALVM